MKYPLGKVTPDFVSSSLKLKLSMKFEMGLKLSLCPALFSVSKAHSKVFGISIWASSWPSPIRQAYLQGHRCKEAEMDTYALHPLFHQ